MIKAAIIGASGYSGAELTKILLNHKCVELSKVFANSSAGKSVDQVYPYFKKRLNLVFEQYTPDAVDGIDVTFIALPSGEAMHIVPTLIEKKKRIIDLGGDFRLKDSTLYEKFYKRNHNAPSYLSKAVYGLPELQKKQIACAQLVANPGCYSTSAILALAPALQAGIIKELGIVVNSLSGVSGAGRSSAAELSFVEVNESVKAYRVAVHQHTPEIQMALEAVINRQVQLTFVPHLLPITRGIYTTIYGELTREVSEEEINELYKKFYSDAPFVRILKNVPEIKNVNYTNYCDIGLKVDPSNNKLVVLSTIDNLVKGAAGQAVQNMNIMSGFPETEGLLT